MQPSLTYVVGSRGVPDELFIRREIEGLRRRGWNLDLCPLYAACDVPRADGPRRGFPIPLVFAALRHALPLAGCLPRLPLQLLRRVPQIAAVARRVRAQGSAGVHAHFAHLPADAALLAARAAGVPFSCSIHAWDVFAQPRAAIRRRLRPARVVVACSRAAAEAAIAAGVAADRVRLVRHGLPLAEYPFTAPRPERQILAVGRLEPKKGFDLLLAACARLPRLMPDTPFQCRILGAGSQRAPLAQLVSRLGLDAVVTLSDGGERSLCAAPPVPATPAAVRAAMLQASVLVLPSRRLANGDRDGVANVLVEAMALGTPVVTTTAGAAAELVRDGHNGRLVPPEDPAALCAAIRDVLHNPPAAARLARAARATIEAEYDDTRTLAELEHALCLCAPERLP